MKSFLLVGFGGMLGSMLRYGVSLLFKTQHSPVATLLVNVAGSFIIGCIAGYAFRQTNASIEWRLFLATGICGGFTTFSAFSIECVQLLQANRFWTAAIYIGASIVLGVAAGFAGFWLGKQLNLNF